MSYHRTHSGHVEFICAWGHGKGSPGNPRRPATLITDDGDGHYQQWKYEGKLDDALKTLARIERRITDGGGDYVAMRYGNGYVIEDAPEDFWNDPAKYPNIIVY